MAKVKEADKKALSHISFCTQKENCHKSYEKGFEGCLRFCTAETACGAVWDRMKLTSKKQNRARHYTPTSFMIDHEP